VSHCASCQRGWDESYLTSTRVRQIVAGGGPTAVDALEQLLHARSLLGTVRPHTREDDEQAIEGNFHSIFQFPSRDPSLLTLGRRAVLQLRRQWGWADNGARGTRVDKCARGGGRGSSGSGSSGGANGASEAGGGAGEAPAQPPSGVAADTDRLFGEDTEKEDVHVGEDTEKEDVHVGAVSGAAAHSLAAVAHKVAYVTLAAVRPIPLFLLRSQGGWVTRVRACTWVRGGRRCERARGCVWGVGASVHMGARAASPPVGS
jgi:hypothetical protein